ETSMPKFPQPTYGFQPTEDLFYALTLSLTDQIARVSRRALINRTAAPLVILGDVRRDLQSAQLLHAIARVIVLIGTDGDTSVTGNLRRHFHGGIALRRPGRRAHRRVDGQAVAVLHQDVPGVAQFGFFAVAFPRQLCVGIRRRGVGRIGPRLAMKIDRWVARIVWGRGIGI